jgi:hypothetical protein
MGRGGGSASHGKARPILRCAFYHDATHAPRQCTGAVSVFRFAQAQLTQASSSAFKTHKHQKPRYGRLLFGAFDPLSKRPS